MPGHAMPASLVRALALADRDGRVLVTLLGGHLTLILPGSVGDEREQARRIKQIVDALDAAGIGTLAGTDQ